MALKHISLYHVDSGYSSHSLATAVSQISPQLNLLNHYDEP